MQPTLAATLLVATLAAAAPLAQSPPAALTAQVRLQDGRVVEGELAAATWPFASDGATRTVAATELLSFHCAAPASAFETERIAADLAALGGADAKAAEAAAAELVEIGLPVLTPLLRSYVDVDAHEPDLRYRLFARILPGHADGKDRSLDLVRLADGSALRGTLQLADLQLRDAAGATTAIPAASVRRLAIRRARVERTFELQALHDCTYVSFLDTGVGLAKGSQVHFDASGYVRLSFDEDGWATDPDGIADPLPGKRRLQEGFRWGAILGRVGVAGDRWRIGARVDKQDLAPGRLYCVINDNEHWQNNIGSYRVHLSASDVYDLGEAR